jgi:hypothetical protein
MVWPSAVFVCLAGLALPAKTRSFFRDGILGHQFDKRLYLGFKKFCSMLFTVLSTGLF